VFPKPVFHGDTLHATTKMISVRDSKSRPKCLSGKKLNPMNHL